MKPTLMVHEICLTLQGESTQAGRLCVLIRLAGCPQSCRYCDTPQARPFDAGRPMSIEEILAEIGPSQCRLVEITGGEPLAQAETADLARTLIERGFEVMVETSGSYPIEVLPAQARRIMDLKCPSSGECERNDLSNIEHLTSRDEVKFVLADRKDYEWAREMICRHRLPQRCEVLFSPVCDRLAPRQLAEWIIADRLPVRLQIQLHKYIWGNARGV